MLHFAQMKAGDRIFKQANEMEPRHEHAHHWHAASCLIPYFSHLLVTKRRRLHLSEVKQGPV